MKFHYQGRPKMRCARKTEKAKAARHAPWRVWLPLLAASVMALGGCATTGTDRGLTIQPLSTAHYAATQTVDVLSEAPQVPWEKIARMTLADPTGTATSSQLIAQLAGAAKNLGADALVVEHVSRAANAEVGFNPAGGQMRADTTGVISITALAVRYTHAAGG